MSKFFMFVGALVCGFSTLAQECKPEYVLEFEPCQHGSHPVRVVQKETPWRTVIKGGKDAKATDCTDGDKIQRVAGDYQGASNIRESDKREIPASHRGLGKIDIQCKYTYDIPENILMRSPACPINHVAATCFDNPNAEFAEQCINAPAITLEQMWQKAGCLSDIRANIARLPWRSMATLNRVNDEIGFLKQTLAIGNDPAKLRLLKWLRDK